jgi:hypothetical protein
MYLAGETEKELQLLQDAYGRDKENKPIKLELEQCHRTHYSLCKGQSCVKRGRYLEAVEHFSLYRSMCFRLLTLALLRFLPLGPISNLGNNQSASV